MTQRPHPRRGLPAFLATAAMLLAPVGVMSSAHAEAATSTSTPAQTATSSAWAPRPADYAQTVTTKDLKIPMSDGTVLRGDLTQPADTGGKAIDKPFPVIVTITAYNKSASAGSPLAGAGSNFLVQRGYAQLTVDARGTGSSQGQWGAFSDRENKDSAEIVEWAADSTQHTWSNGSVGMAGPSYMGINQIFAAAQHPKGLKAIFPQVPAADVYRDVVASGGQVDVGFIPLWLGLVTTTGLLPPSYGAGDPQAGGQTMIDHLGAATTFTAPLLAGAVLGQDSAFDGPFYAERSPINVIDEVDVPAFFVGGEYDLFQRGTPLLFENLEKRGIDTKLILGPWDHLQGSSGAEVGEAGYGSLEELQLRWFDKYVKELPDDSLGSDIAPLTYYEQGSDSWQKADQWIGDQKAVSLRLSGSSVTAVQSGALTDDKVTDGTSTIAPIPVSGACTRSANQWTAGVPNSLGIPNPCLDDNRLNDLTGPVFETSPMNEPFRFQGPINARLYASSLSGDGMLSVGVSSVAPDGTVSRLTGGWQVMSMRKLDESKTRMMERMDGEGSEIVQPYHPFTKESKQTQASGEVQPVDVEVFPTGAVIPKGHRLRVSVQAFDFPHLAPTVPDAPGTLANAITIHNSAEFPSRITLPALTALDAGPIVAPGEDAGDPAEGTGDTGDDGMTGSTTPGDSADGGQGVNGSAGVSSDTGNNAVSADRSSTSATNDSASMLPGTGGASMLLLLLGLVLLWVGAVTVGSQRLLAHIERHR